MLRPFLLLLFTFMRRALIGIAVIFGFHFTLHAQEIRRTPLVLAKGGTLENPAVFDGKGMIIDLGIDITDRVWIKEANLWTSRGPLPDYPPVADTQRAGLFIDEVPLRIVRDRAAEARSGDKNKVIYASPETLKPGEMAWAADGSLYFRWPVGKTPRFCTRHPSAQRTR